MAQFKKLLVSLLSGTKDNDFKFDDLCKLLKAFGFTERTKGNHHIFYKNEVEEIINLQPLGSKVKPYQMKQVRNIILKYKMGEIENV